jgi:hypothetical protein
MFSSRSKNIDSHSAYCHSSFWKKYMAYLVENTILEMDILSSVNSGITNAVKDFLGLVFPLFGWLLM